MKKGWAKIWLQYLFSIEHQDNFIHLAKSRPPFCLFQNVVFLSTPSCSVLNQVMPLFKIFVLFHSTNLLLFVFLSAVSPANSRFAFFFEIFREFRYVSFLFLSSRLKNHICVLWNPNISFNNNNNINNNNNSVPETRKYWVDVQWGIVSSYGQRDPLKPWLAILLEMVSR